MDRGYTDYALFGRWILAGVSDNPVPGDTNWPTQPFPVKPPPLARMSFELDQVAKVTPEHEAYCKALLALEGGAMGGGPYAQYGPKLRVIFRAGSVEATGVRRHLTPT